MPINKTVFLLPVGPYSTEDDATCLSFIADGAVPTYKKILCEWLYNARKIRVITTHSGGSPAPTTIVYEKLPDQDLTQASNYILNVADKDRIIVNFTLAGLTPDDGITGYPIAFYAFVYRGEWYRTKIATDTESISLSVHTLTRGTTTYEATILETFYP